MNKVIMIGRLSKDPEIRYSNGDNPVAYGNYSIAIDRPVARDAEKITDFINCKVIGKTAEFAEKYLKKGMKIAIEGRVQVDKYTNNNGQTVYSTYVNVLSHEFCESKESGSSQSSIPQNVPAPSDEFMSIPDGFDEELPFN